MADDQTPAWLTSAFDQVEAEVKDDIKSDPSGSVFRFAHAFAAVLDQVMEETQPSDHSIESQMAILIMVKAFERVGIIERASDNA